MERLIGKMARRVSGLHEAAFLVAIATLLSQLFGLYRDRLLASFFGAGRELDIYYAAFRIPDFLFVTVASLVSVSVLIPLFSEKQKNSEEESRRFFRAVTCFFVVSMLIVVALAYVFLPAVSKIVVPGFQGKELEEYVTLSRILLLSPLLLGISNLFSVVTQSLGYFFVYAISPLLYNISIIFGILILSPSMGLRGIVFGVIVGALFHAFIQVPFLLRSGYTFFGDVTFRLREMAHIAMISLPRSMALGVSQLSVTFLLAFATLLSSGSVAIFNFSFNLQSVPLSLIGASYSVAAFPLLSRLYHTGRKEEFLEQVLSALRHILIWSLLATVLMVVLRAQVVRVILGTGKFSWTDTRLTIASLLLFSLSLIGQGMILICSRAYYAMGRTRRPLFVNLASSLFMVILAISLVWLSHAWTPFQRMVSHLFRVSGVLGAEVLALPLSYSFAMFLNGFTLLYLFLKDLHMPVSSLKRTCVDAIVAACGTGLVSYSMLYISSLIFDLRTVFGVLAQGITSGVAGLLVGLYILWHLGNHEIRELKGLVSRRIFKTGAVLLEEEKIV